jgi:hypothetical protein
VVLKLSSCPLAEKQRLRFTTFIPHVACDSLFIYFGATTLGAGGFGSQPGNEVSRESHVDFRRGIQLNFGYDKSSIAIGFGGDATVSSRDSGKTRKLAFGYVAGESWSGRTPALDLVDGCYWNSQCGAVEARVLATG